MVLQEMQICEMDNERATGYPRLVFSRVTGPGRCCPAVHLRGAVKTLK